MFTSLLLSFKYSSATSFPTCLEKSWSGLVKRPFFKQLQCNCVSTHGTLVRFRCCSTCATVDSAPNFSAGVCKVEEFDCLYPTFLTFLIQALHQYEICGFRPLTECCALGALPYVGGHQVPVNRPPFYANLTPNNPLFPQSTPNDLPFSILYQILHTNCKFSRDSRAFLEI